MGTGTSLLSDKKFLCLEKICSNCNSLSCTCQKTVFEEDQCENYDSVNNLICLSDNAEVSTKVDKRDKVQIVN